MIFDKIENMQKYQNIPNLNLILEFLKKNDVSKLSEGDIGIKEEKLFVKVLKYVPKAAKENNFEIHKKHTDVQLILKGIEKMQIVNSDYLKKITEYDEKNDFIFYSADRYISDIVVKEKEFIVFPAGEAHKPGCLYEKQNKPVIKLVFKTND